MPIVSTALVPKLKIYFTKLAKRSSEGNLPNFFLEFSNVRTNQLNPLRKDPMASVLKQFTKPVDMLEVGTWFGTGSTKLWFHNLPTGSKITLIDVWKPFLSEIDKEGSSLSFQAMDDVPHLALLSTLRQVYEEERKNKIKISLVRADATNFLANFKSGSFDIIYLDGSHYYQDIKADIKIAKNLIRNGGVICGDDLELLPTEEIYAYASAKKNVDYTQWKDKSFHPGVLLAVYEEFDAVKMDKGFWWAKIRK
tara:strand:+ start:848 stop:1603 length:756 start_codon:yes stop_codon:yes gene_type:complete